MLPPLPPQLQGAPTPLVGANPANLLEIPHNFIIIIMKFFDSFWVGWGSLFLEGGGLILIYRVAQKLCRDRKFGLGGTNFEGFWEVMMYA